MEEEKGSDLNELREVLGTILASYTYMLDSYARVEEVNLMISFEWAMLRQMGLGNKYRDDFKNYRQRWKKAIDNYNSTGGWKDSVQDCSDLKDSLLAIAVSENLITLSKDAFVIQLPQEGRPRPNTNQGQGNNTPHDQ